MNQSSIVNSKSSIKRGVIMSLFARSGRKKPEQHEFYDIPIGSMIELTDIATFEVSDTGSQTLELVERKKYEATDFLRYMYKLVDGEDVAILGVDKVPDSDEYELARFIIDSEEEFVEDLPDSTVLEFPDPENEAENIPVEFFRDDIIKAQMTVVNAQKLEEYEVELHEYAAEDGTIMSVELCGDWLTFYVGEQIRREDVNIFPAEEEEEYIETY